MQKKSEGCGQMFNSRFSSAFSHLVDLNFPDFPYILLHLKESFLRVEEKERADDYIKYGQELNNPTLTLLNLNIFIGRMLNDSLYPDANIFSQILKQLFLLGHENYAQDLYGVMLNRNIYNVNIFQQVLDYISQCQRPNIEFAFAVFKTAKYNQMITTNLYNSILRVIANSARFDITIAITIFKEAKKCGMVDVDTYSNMLAVIDKYVIPHVGGADISRPFITDSKEKFAREIFAKEIFEEAQRNGMLNVSLYNNMLKVIAKTAVPNVKNAEQLLMEAKEKGCVNAHTYLHLLNVIANSATPNVQLAMKFMTEANQFGIVNADFYTGILNVIAKSPSPDVTFAVKIIEKATDEMVNAETVASLLNVIANSHSPDVKLSVKIFTAARQRGMVSTNIFNSLLYVIAESHSPSMVVADEVFKQAHKYGMADANTYINMLKVISNSVSPDLNFARELIREAKIRKMINADTQRIMDIIISKTVPIYPNRKSGRTDAKKSTFDVSKANINADEFIPGLSLFAASSPKSDGSQKSSLPENSGKRLN